MSGRARRGARPELALAAAALALVLVGAELGLRLATRPPRTHDAPLEVDPALGFRGVPGFREASQDAEGPFVFELGTEGWREPQPVPGSRADASQTLLFLGDSFLVGRALRAEALLPAQTLERLADRGVAARAFERSAIDFGTAQQLLALRIPLATLRPDAVVLAFYSGNDVVNNEPALAGLTDVSAGDYYRPYLDAPDFSQPRFLHPLRARLRGSSRLFAWAEHRVLRLALRPRFAWLRPFPPVEAQIERLRRGLPPRPSQDVLREPAPGSAWARGWERSFGLLGAFAREVAAAGARFAVVVIPLEEQVQRGALSVSLDWLAREVVGVRLDDLLDWNHPERRLSAFFAEAGIEALPLLGPLRRSAASRALPYGRDAHWNGTGHALAADAVAAWLLEEPGPSLAPGDGPVDLLPPAGRVATPLDFRSRSLRHFVGDGWLDWRTDSPDAPGGWRLGPRAMAVVPDAGGALVVQGVIGPGVPLPVTLAIEVPGAGVRRPVARLQRPGPFELRVAVGLPRKHAVSEYRVVLVGHGGPLGAEVRIQGLGFEGSARESGAARSRQ